MSTMSRGNFSNMIISKKVQVDPVREMLVKEVEKDSNIPEGLPELKEKTKRVQVGWLFHVRGALALKRLLLTLDSTSDSPNCPGWRDMAYHLELDSLTVNCIKKNMFAGNTDTYYTLLAVAQNHDRTLCHVVEALEKINRFDALQQSKEPIDGLATYVLDNHSTANSSDIIMPPELVIPPSVVLIPDEELLNTMARPVQPQDWTLLLESPMVQKLIKLLTQTQPIQQKILQYSDTRMCNDTLVRSAPVEPRNSPPPVKKNAKKMHYDCIIMLTFASDGENYVPDIVDSLRKERKDGRHIGVLILEEHSAKVELDPQQFIATYFNQVHYIMPVITPGYLKSIVSISPDIYRSPNDFLDTKWTRYIYTLMNSDYIRRGCLNKKVRCVVPDDFLELIQTHRRMREPIFETWDRASNIDNMGDRLLNNIKRCK